VAAEVAVVVAEVTAVAVAAGVSAVAVAAEVTAEVPGVTAGDHQVVVPPEEAVMGVSGTQAAGLRLPEAPAVVVAVVALIVEAVRERGTGAVLIAEAVPERGTGAAFSRREPGAVEHGRKLEAGVRTLAETSKADVKMLVERNKAGVRIQGQSGRTLARIVSTSGAMI
jgi:hypothetical protein